VTLTPERSIRDVVIENPAAADVLEKLDIDYYCRGGRALGDILSGSGLSLEAFMAQVDQAMYLRRGNPPSPDWRFVSVRKLIGHIVDTHHAYLRFELPALDKWITNISEQQHGEREVLLILQRPIQRFHQHLEVQMRKEEAILFPAISDLETAVVPGVPSSRLLFGSVANLSRATEDQNNRAAGELQEIRVLTNNYASPPGASTTLSTLFERLRILTACAHQHFHLENNILFPRAINLEKGKIPCH
jgi:regulator of cell morphogenesis and NO signaling